jgi:hypothetical protein
MKGPKPMRQLLLSVAVFALLLSSAQAQSALKLEIKDGRVNLDATSVPVRQILAEWANVGGTKVVGGDRITGAPLTLKLVDVAERQALDIILRNVAGYMAAPRLASAAPGASAYDRILILPTSVSAGAAASNNNNASRLPMSGAMAGTERRIPTPPRPPGIRPNGDEPDDEPDSNETADTGINPGQPVFTFPQQQMPGNQVFVPVAQGGTGQPGFATQPQITLQPSPNGQPTLYNFVPTGQAPSHPGAFTVIGSPTPGVIQQTQPIVAPGQPVQVPPKPPGQN